MPDLIEILDRLPPGSGPIGLLSSDEFTPATAAFDRDLIPAGAHVALLTCAGHENEHDTMRQAQGHLDARLTLFDHEPGAPSPTDASTDAEVIYIPGGDPRALLRCMRGARAWEHVLKRWRTGATLVGSSAGAMALCTNCLVAREGDHAPTEWSGGLGPLENVGIAAHAATRPGGWLRGVAETSRLPVLAIDDATGVILRAGDDPRVVGPGRAVLL